MERGRSRRRTRTRRRPSGRPGRHPGDHALAVIPEERSGDIAPDEGNMGVG